MDHEHRDETRNPWPWVGIVIGMLIFLGASWWIATAGTRGNYTPIQPTTTQPMQPAEQPSQQPAKQPAAEKPTVTEQQPRVSIYVERTPQQPDQSPVVVIVPEGQQPPKGSDGTEVKPVDLPARFKYQGSTWDATDQAVSPDPSTLTDTGASVNGNEIYVDQTDKPPYDAVYVETEPGSGVYVKYTKRSND